MPDALRVQFYRAEQRASHRTTVSETFYTDDVTDYQADGQALFGTLSWLAETSLSVGGCVVVPVSFSPTAVLLLPVAGGLEYRLTRPGDGSGDNSEFLEPGQSRLMILSAGQSLTIANPYPTGPIRFLQLELRLPAEARAGSPTNPAAAEPVGFDLSRANTLLPLFARPGAAGFIGRYAGRQSGQYGLPEPATGQDVPANEPTNGLFFFVIQGVFEVQDRLLHAGDGLSLRDWPGGVVDWEALSNDAILLLLAVATAE